MCKALFNGETQVGTRVLVIEDNTKLAANIVDYLEGCGHLPDAAGDGLTGLHLAATNPYDVIVLDVGLPGIDGISLPDEHQIVLRFQKLFSARTLLL